MRVTVSNGGTISHHHGIGILRSRWIHDELGEAIGILKEIKRALDVNGIMNTKDGMFMKFD